MVASKRESLNKAPLPGEPAPFRQGVGVRPKNPGKSPGFLAYTIIFFNTFTLWSENKPSLYD